MSGLYPQFTSSLPFRKHFFSLVGGVFFFAFYQNFLAFLWVECFVFFVEGNFLDKAKNII